MSALLVHGPGTDFLGSSKQQVHSARVILDQKTTNKLSGLGWLAGKRCLPRLVGSMVAFRSG